MDERREIYVRLLGEAVDVWRPVQAEHLLDDIYLIADQLYDRESETWQFVPGEKVVCRLIPSAGGSMIAATELA